MINCLRFIPTPLYLRLVFLVKAGKALHLKNPKSFCDKQNYLKIHEIHPEYTDLVDKIKVRDYVNEIMGKDMFFPVYGVWDKFSDIDFDSLPDKFVLKCNHDSGSVKIISDKNSIDKKELDKFYTGRLKLNPYVLSREYPYKDVKPQIMAEKYMREDENTDIKDYKFFCFDGKPFMLFVATDRSSELKFDFFDMDFNHMDIQHMHPQSDDVIDKPSKFDEMKEIATRLSKGMKFVRIDLYEVGGKIYFGEFTFFHGGGMWPFYPDSFDDKLASMIELD